MELSLALDPGVGAAVAAPSPGTDANDPAAEAFAALLASLVATIAPPPTAVPVAVPEATAASAPAAEAPAATALPVVLALPAAVPTVAGADEGAEPAPPTVAVPVPADAPDVPTPVPAFSSPPGPETGRQGDENGEDGPEAPVRAATAAPAGTATVTAEAAAPVVARSFSSPEGPESGPQRDQNAPGPVVAAAPAAPQVLKPEVAKGPVAPPPPATPVEQVVRAVAPLRQLADGTHSILLELRPTDLGVVRVELSLAGGVVHLGLHADTEGTSQLLRAALPELRAQLDSAGLVAGRLDVDHGAGGQRGDREPSWRSDADTRPGPAIPDVIADDLAPTASSSSALGQIDVLL